jgi:hypothetical protein
LEAVSDLVEQSAEADRKVAETHRVSDVPRPEVPRPRDTRRSRARRKSSPDAPSAASEKTPPTEGPREIQWPTEAGGPVRDLGSGRQPVQLREFVFRAPGYRDVAVTRGEWEAIQALLNLRPNAGRGADRDEP